MLKRLWYDLRMYVRYIDKLLLLIAIIASGYGLVLIYSATYSYNTMQYVNVQLFAVCVGILVYFIAAMFDIEFISRFWVPILIFNLLLLGSLYFFGVAEGGNKGWIRFGKIGIQPSELGKIIFIVSFAGHINALGNKLNRPLPFLSLIAHAGITAGFVMLFSKDDGMTLAFLFIACFMMFAAGVKLRWFAACGAVALSSIPLIWNMLLDEYQQLRILVIFYPELDADVTWQATQSKIALRAGGILGKGLLKGSQTQYSIIPAKHTDSIFSVAGEELGYIGCACIILLLLLVVVRCVYIAFRTAGSISSVICMGVAGMFIFQTCLNIGMNIGVLPVIGLTLPFFSYGGTSIIAMYAALGIVAGVRMREKRNRDLMSELDGTSQA